MQWLFNSRKAEEKRKNFELKKYLDQKIYKAPEPNFYKYW